MEIKDIQTLLPWKNSIGRRRMQDILYAVVHHNGGIVGDTYDPISTYRNDAQYHISKGWGHIAYHFRIARDGKIYQTYALNEIGAHAGNWKYNKAGIGICLDGNFAQQDPSGHQIDSLNWLMKHLSTERPDIPNLFHRGFYAHSEVRLSPTFCPGPKIRNMVVNFRKTGKV